MTMMDYPLLVRNILERSRRLFARKEIFSRDYSSEFRYTYGGFYDRACRLANVLEGFGIKRGDRVATCGWNSHRHLELYYAVPCMGSVLLTLNFRLFREHFIHVINHAEPKVIFVDEDLLPIIDGVKDEIETVKQFVVMTDKATLPETKLSSVYLYEELMDRASASHTFPEDLDERSPASMCYTTGTTGGPKGVQYSHRAIFLHSLAQLSTASIGIAEQDVVMPVVPMFHVNCWGMPYTSAWVGSRLVLPGCHPDARLTAELIQKEKVTVTAAVPTVLKEWLTLMETERFDLSSLRVVVGGGSAVPRALIEDYEKKLGVLLIQGYGLTETTPGLTISRPKSYMADWTRDRVYEVQAKQGLFLPGLEFKVVNDKGEEVGWDGKEMGEVIVRGPWVMKEYYMDPEMTAQVVKDGWFYTRDIATVDEEGYINIKDRAKDVVKSGGEWISSIDLENAMMAHPGVAEAAVIAIPDRTWDERPLAYVVLKSESKGTLKKEDILDFIAPRFPKWWLPNDVLFVDMIPKTSVGKFDKKLLRDSYGRR